MPTRPARFLVRCLWLIATMAVTTAHATDTAGVRPYNAEGLTGALAGGGYLLLLQHAADIDAPPADAGTECGDVLSEAERMLAGAIGQGLRAAGIPVARIGTAPGCAAVETARALDLGEAEVDDRLAHVAVDSSDAGDIGRLRQVLSTPVPETENVLLVTYGSNVARLLKVERVAEAGTLHVLRTGESVSYVGSVAPDRWTAAPAAAAASSAAPPVVVDDALVGPSWWAEDIGGGGVIDNLRTDLHFTGDGRIHGTGGCNAYNGNYVLDGQALSFPPPRASTRRACPPAVMDQDDRFHATLDTVRGYRIDNGLLYLLDENGGEVLRLAPRP